MPRKIVKILSVATAGILLLGCGNDGGESAVLRSYKFFDVFPITVGYIALSYDTTDALEEFDVTFRYQYFTIGNSAQSSGGTGEVLIT